MLFLSDFKIIQFASILLIAVILYFPQTNGAKILGVFTSHSPSHFIVHMSVMKSLAEAGHNVTVFSSLQPKITHPAIQHIIVPPTEEQEKLLTDGMDKIAAEKKSFVSMIMHLFSTMFTMISIQSDILKDESFTQLYNERFDLIFLGYFLNDFQLGLGAKFKTPIIYSWTSSPNILTDSYVGNPMEISYVPDMNLAIEQGKPMNFQKRFENFIMTSVKSFFLKLISNYHMQKFYGELFGKERNFPMLSDMRKNVSLIFCNSHFSEGPIRPNVPAIIEIGGIQVKEKPDPLPKDIADFLKSAEKDGAILFCLGSNLKSSNIKPKIIQIIFKTLSSLKQKVIWKWDDLNDLPGEATNILYKKWIPQDDILAHPNIKLFITHAGKGGISEAQFHAVPMLALPIFAEQPGNAEKMKIAGYGLHLDIFSMTEYSFKQAIIEILTNSTYKEKIQQFSNLYRDRPLSAKQSVVYWTEYVLRHHGAQHMQSPLVHLNFFQSTSLDVICFLILIIYVFCKTSKFIFKFILRKISSKNKGVQTLKKKNI